MNARASALIAGLALGAVAVWPAHAEVPTPADFKECNMKAAEQAAADTASASPKTELPKAGAPRISSDKDPQVEGLAADRATDPAYVAAYRSCMRQRGF